MGINDTHILAHTNFSVFI